MATTLKAASGLGWFRETLAAIRKQPFALCGIVFFYIAAGGILSGVPFVGPVLASFWMPFGAVLVAFASRAAHEGRQPVYQPLIECFRRPDLRRRLLMQGLICAAAMEVITFAFGFAAAPVVSRWTYDNGVPDVSSILANIPWAAIAITVFLYIPVLCATMFAPILAADAAQPVGKSFFYSFFGVVRNFSACFTALLTIVGLTVGCALLINLLLLVSGLGGLLPYLSPLFVMGITVIAQCMVWPAYRDIFGPRDLF